MSASVLRQFVQVMLMGETLSLWTTLTEDARIDDPTLGRMSARDAVRLGALWRDRGAARDPRWISFTERPERVVGEFEIDVIGPQGQVPLPVAVVAEPGEDARLSAVRLYHSFWPLESDHRLRAPLLECVSDVPLSGVMRAYQDALAAGDVDEVLACFSDDGVAREPAGGQWTHHGTAGLTRFYSSLFSAGGGISLRHCTVTDDGERCCIEYVADRWGAGSIEPQAGVAVYERNGDLIGAARIYDDIRPPR